MEAFKKYRLNILVPLWVNIKRYLLYAFYILVPFGWVAFIYTNRYRFERMFHFAKMGWRGYDYDYGFVEEAYGAMLKRQLNLFTSNRSFVDWSEPDAARAIKALRIVTKILGGTGLNRADRVELPDPVYTLEPTGKDTFTMKFSDSDAWKEYMRLSTEDDKINERRKQTAYRIIAKYRNYWWD